MAIIELSKDDFNREVLEAENTVLVDFWASWCGPCRILEPILTEAATEMKNVKIGKVNVDKEPYLAEKYGILSVPTLLVFRDGKLIRTLTGVQTKAQLLEVVK